MAKPNSQSQTAQVRRTVRQIMKPMVEQREGGVGGCLLLGFGYFPVVYGMHEYLDFGWFGSIGWGLLAWFLSFGMIAGWREETGDRRARKKAIGLFDKIYPEEHALRPVALKILRGMVSGNDSRAEAAEELLIELDEGVVGGPAVETVMSDAMAQIDGVNSGSFQSAHQKPKPAAPPAPPPVPRSPDKRPDFIPLDPEGPDDAT